ncbi:THO complex subunit 4D-like [Malania oleifera]|uniref:THO complex subunit 4D-like n=1 Tax=Malania oleifera TaxID=397392 RepID=UPI0025AE02B9|nr:THO complex subunit 4D-like [Malania oleifera]XP_057970344.1 THO complex subunit 4D-like [Malania oleifera]
MATSLDMSLEDIIKNRSNIERVRGRGRVHRGRGAGGPFSGGRLMGTLHRGPLRVNARPSAYAIAKPVRRSKNFPWQPDLFEDSLRAAGIQGIESGTKIYVSNLDYGVTNEDIRELFSEIGELRRYAIHYDKNGRPSGSAEVVYVRRSYAFAAVKRYNNVQLDGKPMKIEIVGANPEVPVSARVNVVGGVDGRKRRTLVMTPGMVPARVPPAINRGFGQRNRGALGTSRGGRGRGRGRGHGRGRGRGRDRGRGGRGRKPTVEKSADQLDKELENYHAEAMHT